MTPEQIIRQLREHLLKRVIARNPLLHFRPASRGFRRVDLCSLFQVTSNRQEIINSASGFFSALMENGEAHLQDEGVGARLIKMQKEADDLARASGLGSVILGWPLVNIVRQQGQKPLCAPLFFWKVRIHRAQNDLTIALESEDIKPEPNFVLRAWWNHHQSAQIPNWDFGENDIGDFADIKEKSMEAANILNCHFNNDALHNGATAIEPYVQDDENNCFLPSATLGIASFKGQAMLKELEDLGNKYQKDAPQNNLLSNFLTQPAETTCSPEEASTPSERNRYLAGEADPSQEKCIWQTKEEQTKILLLKGPPGTGKSETIVNLIADAVRDDKFVVVACHKQTAIDVLQKRLGDKGMDSLVVKTTEPRKDRWRIISQIRDTVPSTNSTNLDAKREVVASNIEDAEKKCTRYANAISQNNLSYSVKGHFRAKIEDVAKNPDCDNFNVLNPRHSDLIEKVRVISERFRHDQDEQKARVNAVQEYANSYLRCDFSNNPWNKSQNNSVYMPSLTALWEDALNSARRAQEERTNLPSRAISKFMTSAIAPARFLLLGTGERHAAIKNFVELVSQTKQAFAMAGMPARPLWQKAYDNNAEESYREHLAKINDIPTILEIRQQRENDVLIQFFHDNFGDGFIASWHKILEAIFCGIALMEIEQESGNIFGGTFTPQKFDDKVNALRQAKEEKNLLDIQSVLQKQMHCETAIYRLRQIDLLRLVRRGRRRATTLRQLYHHGRGSIEQIAPVLMTNPDSLCQLLPLEPEVIDLAIVDEASQMFTADALPILFRAKKIVVSGDNMQMPPDDLFALAETDDDNEEQDNREIAVPPLPGEIAPAEGRFELLEAIDHLLTHDSPARCNLEVHYRSRPVELIAFSNHAFYGGKLQAATDNGTLPDFMKTPIQMIRTAGMFDGGINEIEANKIIELLKKIWQRSAPPSIGVIVCNVKQAEYLKQRIAEKCARDQIFQKKYEAAASQQEDGEDVSFFVRSIEHVQGDERDVIIFATTYGNRVRNYGPINTKEKGRRRLNVAVTRAKLGMFVITSLNINNISNPGERPDSADEGGGNERWFLWQYLKYALAISDKNTEAAVAVLHDLNEDYAPRLTGREPDSEFEIQVGKFLESQNYHVDYQVGESGFRIDIGVKQNAGGRYLCGIECDGRAWHSGWRARQNDIWRQGILEGKGWKIYRIWSDYWFRQRNAAQEALLHKLRTLLNSQQSDGQAGD